MIHDMKEGIPLVGYVSGRVSNLVCFFVVGALIVTFVEPLFCATKPENPERDVFISGLVLYARLAEHSPEAKEHGSYPQLMSYNLHKGIAPRRIDVVAVVNGQSAEVVVILEVFPVVGLTNWRRTEGVTDRQLLQTSKTVLSSALRLEQKVRLNGRMDVKFSDISLLALISRWKDRDFWPAEMIFKVTIDPIKGETALSNNVMEFKLPIQPPD